MTTDHAAVKFVYDLLRGDATLAGLIDERSVGEPAIYTWGLADQGAPERHIVVDVPAATDINVQGSTAIASILVSVTTRGESVSDVRAASARADTLLRGAKGVEGGFTICAERLSIQPITGVDAGAVFRHVAAVYRLYVGVPQ